MKIMKNLSNNERYIRNRLYITPEEQELISNCKLVLGGAGLGSNIAECALRLGIENICIIDGDTVELSNLNRQNYLYGDIGLYKAEVLYRRLKEINPDANITYIADFLDRDNIENYLKGASIAINALDFTSDIPHFFDEFCVDHNITVLHPYNLGWAALVAIVNSKQSLLSQLGDSQQFELKMGEHIVNSFKEKGDNISWLSNIIDKLKNEGGNIPQLSVGSWGTASLCTRLLFKILTSQKIKVFPEFYYVSMV